MVWLKCHDVVLSIIINIAEDEAFGAGSLLFSLISAIQESDPTMHCPVPTLLKQKNNKVKSQLFHLR
jgi:hypothetical protein